MEVGKLTVQLRNNTGKGTARKLRANGDIPGVCYGAMLEAPVPISVNARALKASLDPIKRQNTVIDVAITDNGQPVRTIVVMVKEYQIDKIRRDLVHVDLQAIDTDKVVDAQVPIEFTGKPKGLIAGGQLHVVRHELMIRCKPMAIPPKIEVDVSDLDIGDVLHVSDLKLPMGLIATTPGRLTVATFTAPEGDTGTAAEGEAPAAEAKGAPAKGGGGKAPAAKAAPAAAKAPAKGK